MKHIAASYAFALLVCILSVVQANTEIVNIHAARFKDTGRQPPALWPTFSSNSSELTFKLDPIPLNVRPEDACNETAAECPHDLWTVLNFDDPAWRSFSKFTLRVSLPANHPTDCSIHVFHPSALPPSIDPLLSPKHVSNEAGFDTRRQYARIRLIDTGIRPPPFTHTRTRAVPFNVILEPLYFDVLPASVVPVLGFLLPIVVVAWFVVAPRVHRYLSSVAEGVREDKVPQFKMD